MDGFLTMMNGSKLEADEVLCDGSISMDGQICADTVRADGLIRAREIDVYKRQALGQCGCRL